MANVDIFTIWDSLISEMQISGARSVQIQNKSMHQVHYASLNVDLEL